MTVGIVSALLVADVGASTLQVSDAQRVHALRVKLHATTADITQAMEQAKANKHYGAIDCLHFIHSYANSIELILAGVDDLTVLSLLMKDSADEIYVLKALRTSLTVLTNYFINAPKMINESMAGCAGSAMVNVKGQNLLNLLSDWRDPLGSILQRISRVSSL
jgi:hypothetical protein